MASIVDDEGNIVREPTTVEEAESFLWHVSSKLGGPPGPIANELQGTSTGVQQYVNRLQREIRKDSEKLITMVVKAIYTQDSRYVYELIQNADDVSYTSTFEPPSLTFTLDHEKLTIDTNEDGFTAANVKAVCSVNESSKKLSEEDDSIGEKGIGFKSVFNVAQSVRIQSGLWSFQFNNDPNDALSMFIPVPVAQQVLDEGVRTRITLRYHHGKTKEIADALAALHDNTIAFLRRIVKLKIIYRLSDVSWSSTLSRELTKTYDENHHMLTLKSVTRVQHRGNQSQEKHYRLFKQTFKDMPADDRRRRRTAEVQLAFPVDPETQTPQISEEGEDIFAFLPMMRRREIPFIIQSDFITLINRESVVSCQWNTKLRENIAKAFTDAMIQLAVNDKQHYEWLEYLPRSPIDGFWEPLPSLIFDTIKSQNLLKPYAEEELRPATDLSILPDSFLHEGTPLLDDTELFETCYLSPEYIERGFDRGQIASRFGRADIKVANESTGRSLAYKFCGTDRGGKYYAQSKLYRFECRRLVCVLMEDNNLSFADMWANFEAQILNVIADKDTANAKRLKERIWSLKIIPLKGDSWAAPSQIVYFPTVDGQEIPGNLGFNLVRQEALGSGEQKSMYETFGVSECDPQQVVNRILEYQLTKSKTNIGRGPWRKLALHLQFLHFAGTSLTDPQKQQLLAFSNDGKCGRACDGFYFPSTQPHDTQSLLQVAREKGVLDDNFRAGIILHDLFLPEGNSGAFHHGRTWKQWLEEFAHVRTHPRLATRHETNGSFKLSPILSKVLEANSPFFLQTLRAHWTKDYASVYQQHEQDLHNDISAREVRCINDDLVELQKSFFQSTQLRQIADEMEIREFMPFVDTGNVITNHSEWKFLTNFGVQFDVTLSFWLESILNLPQARPEDTDEIPPSTHQSARRIYENIGRLANEDNLEQIKTFFDDYAPIFQADAIYQGAEDPHWLERSDCLWQGPTFLTTRCLLERQYPDSVPIKKLFVDVLGVRNANKKDILSELKSRKESARRAASPTSDLPLELLTNVYTELDKYNSEFAMKGLKESFEEGLIYVEGNWFKPSDCVWDFQVADLGKPKLRDSYGDLQAFFVEKLGVPTVTGNFLLRELQRLAELENANTPILGSDVEHGDSSDGLRHDTDTGADEEGENEEEEGSEEEDVDEDNEDDGDDDEKESAEEGEEDQRSVSNEGSQASEDVACLDDRDIGGQAINPSQHRKSIRQIMLHLASMIAKDEVAGDDDGFWHRLDGLKRSEQKFLPVIQVSGGTPLRSMEQAFFINDHSTWGRKFKGKVDMLDFNCEESCTLKWFLNRLGLQNRYLSSQMQQITEPHEPSLDSTMTDDMRTRSYAYSCFAIQCDSRKYFDSSTHERLLGTKVYTCPDLRTELRLDLSSDRHVREKADLPMTVIHGVESGQIEIYLPSSNNDRRRCYRSSLPRQMRELLGIGSPSAEQILSTLLTEKLPNLYDVLEDSGVPLTSKLEIIELPLADLSQESSHSATGGGSGFSIRTRRSTSGRTQAFGTNYVQLLKNIIGTFRSQSRLPEPSPYINVSRYEAFDMDEDPEVLAKIGAAGELIVFESLMNLNLANFGIPNWQSTVRRHVSSVDEYSFLPAWRGQDLDFVLEDDTGRVEEWLRKFSYDDFAPMPRNEGLFGRPGPSRKFILEVKTTLGACSDRMFMSSNQYQRMRANRTFLFGGGGGSIPVFVIVRVYNLLSQRPGIMTFVDPARLEGSALTFNSKEWHVVANV